jgi:hypothetical protein
VTRPERPQVRRLRAAQAERDGLRWPGGAHLHDMLADRASPFGEYGRELPEETGTIRRSAPHAQDRPTAERARTVVAHDIEFIIDDAGLRVRVSGRR